MSPETILSKHAINNPADAALVRLAHSAAAFPDEDVEPLLQRSNITNDLDKALGRALVESVRDGVPTAASPTPSGTSKVLRVSLGVTVLALFGLLALNINAGREYNNLQLEKTKTETELSTLKKTKETDSAALTKQTEIFIKGSADFADKSKGLSVELEKSKEEIGRLKSLVDVLTKQLAEAQKK